MRIIELRNDFHNTSRRVLTNRNTALEAWEEICIDAAQSQDTRSPEYRRRQAIWRDLCGIQECYCCTVRGPQID